MKYLLFLLSTILLTSCGSSNEEATDFDINAKYDITKDNYKDYITISNDKKEHKTVVKPRYNKHLIYKDCILKFKSQYQYRVDSEEEKYLEETDTYEYEIDLDSSGSGAAIHAKVEHLDNIVYEYSLIFEREFESTLLSISGSISFENNYTSVKKLKDNESNQRVSLAYGALDNLPYCCYWANKNFKRNINADTFYVIESVHVRFTSKIDNVNRDFSFTFNPNLNGFGEVKTELRSIDNAQNLTYRITNGYLLKYN